MKGGKEIGTAYRTESRHKDENNRGNVGALYKYVKILVFGKSDSTSLRYCRG